MTEGDTLDGGQDHEARLAEQHHRLALARAGYTPPAPEPYELEDSVATAPGVSVVVRDRRVIWLDVHPELVAQPPGAVAQPMRDAINAALEQSLIDTPGAGDPGPDLAALGQQLADFTRQGGEALRRIQVLLEASMAKTGIRGDSTSQYVDHLFQDAMGVVASTQAALSADPAPLVVGEGSDDDNEITAAVSGGQVHALTLTVVALQYPLAQLTQAVIQAVNTAIDEWERLSGAADRPALDVAALQAVSEQAEKVREQSMQHLRAYTTNLTSIMRTVD
ncbi:hypothetical protein ACFWN2_13380 [Lentzea sp. NPDC058436]|uniref:hypothetical protein n=1 Tax=Lentzea sp. NPDC058436 TaxID=3346499 RepID=UPI0036615881